LFHLTKLNKNNIQGFTLIEAIVSLALFAVAFSGLYLFFGMATVANNNTEKRMYLNLLSNHIIESIAAESTRTNSDTLNPFTTPSQYSADLRDCTAFDTSDIRKTWCDTLTTQVGPFKSLTGEERIIELERDGANLIVNVIFAVDGGSGSDKLVSTFFTRKIRP
tara:strand:- start:58 stop:549 length:492 start_codon:yes stop_codon:yes gene_type:complete